MKVAVFGLGKLGLPMTALFASRDQTVIAVDNSTELVEKLQKGQCPIQEPRLAEYLERYSRNIKFTTDYGTAISQSQIGFVMVPTPTNEIGIFSSKYVLDVVEHIVQWMPRGYIVVITSTVTPGTLENEIKPILERTGLRCGRDFGLCYNPEFIALGSVIRDMSEPDGLLIGESDSNSGALLEQFYAQVCSNKPQVCRMSWWNAEVAKLALNVAITTKISIVNTFGQVCESVPGGNIDDVVRFLGTDSRIGPKYLTSGLGFGGPCFPRDNRAFISFATLQKASQCPLQIATDALNESQVARAVAVAEKMIEGIEHPTVSLLGLTYKPNTPVIEESRAMRMAQRLAVLADLRVYDPQGMPNAKKLLTSGRVTFTEDPTSCIGGSDLCIIATPWQEFRQVTPVLLTLAMRRPALFDCWRMFKKVDYKDSGVIYRAIGVNCEG